MEKQVLNIVKGNKVREENAPTEKGRELSGFLFNEHPECHY